MINYGKFRHPNFVTMPTIIVAVGQYVTRCGEIVTVEEIEIGPYGIPGAGVKAANGHYGNGIKESWDVSGRLYSGQTCDNDIVAPHT